MGTSGTSLVCLHCYQIVYPQPWAGRGEWHASLCRDLAGPLCGRQRDNFNAKFHVFSRALSSASYASSTFHNANQASGYSAEQILLKYHAKPQYNIATQQYY